jgi:hypothetical protein
VGFFYNPLIGGRGHGDMVFVWNRPVCIVDFESYLQQVFWEKLEKEIDWRWYKQDFWSRD